MGTNMLLVISGALMAAYILGMLVGFADGLLASGKRSKHKE